MPLGLKRIPFEIVRIVRSSDPKNICAVRAIAPNSQTPGEYRVV